MVEASPLLLLQAVASFLLLVVVRAESPPQLLLMEKVAVSSSLLLLEVMVVNSLPLLADKVVASLGRPVRVVRAEERDKEDRAAAKEAERVRVDTERAKEEDSMAVVSKITAGEVTMAMARAKVQVTDMVEKVKVEASSRALSPAMRSLRAVVPILILALSPHPRRAQGKRWI